MNTDWHDMIQRHIAGSTTLEEAMTLQEALKADAELRALYLDYMNLDMALGAAAERAMPAANESDKIHSFPRPSARWSSSSWRWVAAAACAALIMLAMLPRHRDPAPLRPDVAVTISSAQQVIAQMTVESPAPLPEWASPTASMLDPPRLPQ